MGFQISSDIVVVKAINDEIGGCNYLIEINNLEFKAMHEATPGSLPKLAAFFVVSRDSLEKTLFSIGYNGKEICARIAAQFG